MFNPLDPASGTSTTTSTTSETTAFVNPSGTTDPTGVSTVSPSQQKQISQVLSSVVPLSPGTTTLMENALLGLAALTKEMNLSDYLDALRDKLTQQGLGSVSAAIEEAIQEAVQNYSAQAIDADKINTDTTNVNNLGNQVAQAVPGYNQYIQQLQQYQNTYNQDLQAVQSAASQYNTKSPSTVTNYKNAVNNLNAAASNFNNLNSQIQNGQGGASAVQNYISLVNQYNAAVQALDSDVADKNQQITALNQSPNAALQEPLVVPPNLPSAPNVSLPSSVTAQTLNSSSAPGNIPPSINANANTTSFSPAGTIPVGLSEAQIQANEATTLTNIMTTYLAAFASLDSAINAASNIRVPLALFFLNSFLDESAGLKTQKDVTISNGGGSPGTGGLATGDLQGAQAENAFNKMLNAQTLQDQSIQALNNDTGLKAVLQTGSLSPNGQIELTALVGQSQLISGILASNILGSLIQSGVNVQGQITNVATAVALVSILVVALEQAGTLPASALNPTTAAGASTTPLTGAASANAALQFQLTGLLLAAGILGQAAGNQNLLLEGLLTSLQTFGASPTPAQVAQNLLNLQGTLTPGQTSQFQQDLQANLAAVLTSNNLDPDLANQLASSIVNSSNDTSDALADAVGQATDDQAIQQQLLDSVDLTANLTNLQIQNASINSSVQNSLIFSQSINEQTQNAIQNGVASTLSSSGVANSSAIAQQIAQQIAQITSTGASASTVVTQVQLAIQQDLGGSSTPQLASAVFNNVQSSILTQGITNAIISTFSNKNSVLNQTDLAKELNTVINQIGESFAQTLQQVAQANDKQALEQTTESFKATIGSSVDLNQFVAQILNPGNTFVGIMYEGMKTASRKGWLDFAV